MFIPQRFLYKIFPAFRQPRIFQDPFQNHFSPIALRFCISFQGIGQVNSLQTDLIIQLYQFSNPTFQYCPFCSFSMISFIHFLPEFHNIFIQRLQNLLYILPVHFCKTPGFIFQNLSRQIPELFLQQLLNLTNFFLFSFQLFFRHMQVLFQPDNLCP